MSVQSPIEKQVEAGLAQIKKSVIPECTTSKCIYKLAQISVNEWRLKLKVTTIFERHYRSEVGEDAKEKFNSGIIKKLEKYSMMQTEVIARWQKIQFGHIVSKSS